MSVSRQSELTSIRFDLKTIKILADNENITIDEFLNIINKSKILKEKKKQIRKNAKKLKKVNQRRKTNGLGTLIKPGWKVTSFQTNGISISLIMTKSILRMADKSEIITEEANFEKAKELMKNGTNKVRLISDDTGRVNLDYTAELKSDGTYKHKRLTKLDYYKKSSINYYTARKEKEKKSNTELLEIEKKISNLGGFKTRTFENYKNLMIVYVNECHDIYI